MALGNAGTGAKLLFKISYPLLVRSASAVVAIALSIIALHLGSPYCDVLAIVLTFGMLRELSRMTLGNALHPIVFTILLQMSFILYEPYLPESFRVPLMVTALITNIFTLAKIKNSTHAVILMAGSAYICISMLILIKLMHQGGLSVNFIYWLLVLIWVNDTAAFLIGKKFGKTKLAPAISPHKTWEGLIGALFVGTITASLLAYAFKIESIFAVFLPIIAFSLSIASHVGDLIESAIKRFCKVKDTGSIMPGHGGLLDRLDSLLFVNIVIGVYALFGLLRFSQ